MQLLIYSVSFFFVALAAKKIGEWFSKIGLPYITGYLLAGMLAGPFILNIMPSGSSDALRYIDEISLGIIAFIAGSELYLKEIRSQVKSISWIAGGVILAAMPIIGVALFLLTEFIPFTQGMPTVSRLAIAILGGVILLALSPASTIAVIKEARAKGNFTKTILGVTVTMDVVIILLFAVAVAVAGALLNNMSFNGTFVLILALDLVAAGVIGLGVGFLLRSILSLGTPRLVKTALIVGLGYLIFVAGFWIVSYSYDNLPFEIHIEPILVAMIGGFFVTNYTPYRDEFAKILHDVGPVVYVAFFTLTGVAIKLDILAQTWPIAIALFGVRAAGIGIGSFVGSRGAGENAKFSRFAWMGLITQAGIALGLAREVAVEFPALGDAFATMVISVVVLNEIFGPMFFKYALGAVDEAHTPDKAAQDEMRDAVILGIEPQSVELARQLRQHNWQVIMADTDRSHVDAFRDKIEDEEGILVHYLPTISKEAINGMFGKQTDAVVGMLEDDNDNLKALDIAYEVGIPRLIVRPHDLSLSEQFSELNALVIDPASAMVNLLDQSVRAPQSAAVVLHQDSGRELVQVTVNNPDIDGTLLRDLRLPSDVLFLDVTRNGTVIVPSGYTRLKLEDEVTIIGRGESLDETMLKLGF